MRSCGWKYFLLIIVFPWSLNAQEYAWWNQTHQWDGHTHWSSYMKLSPAFMGPNAFPIPEPEPLTTERNINLRFSNHMNPGEVSRDVFTQIALPLGTKAALKIMMNPVEYFEMDSMVRNQRVVRDEFPKGYASGDVLLETNALIFKKNNQQMTFNFGLKTASGSQFRNARYTDAPAYYLNLSYFSEKELSSQLSCEAGVLLGLYVWQTYRINNRQNDAFLAALAFNLYFKDYSFAQSLRGFKGYLNNGDQPLLYKVQLTKQWNTKQIYFSQQWSIHDYSYNTSQLGLVYYF